MSIIQSKTENGKVDSNVWSIDNSKLKVNAYKDTLTPSPYNPSQEERDLRGKILKEFALGYMTMYTPRVEFSDLCVIDRMQVDQMSFNAYQPNNGGPIEGDQANAWRSRAMKPIVRNKVVSIAAHATARLIFPKVFAYNDNSDSQREAAQVMRDLMEWSADQSNYGHTSLHAVISALTDPAAIVYTEYGEVYRTVKRPQATGGYKQEKMLDSTLSGFKDTMVSCDELFIENFYEPDIQKQGWLIWRRVYGYGLAESKYAQLYPDKFKYVNPGVQVIYNDANQSFYQVYDTNMRPYDVEEVIYWNRNLDLKIIMVNGVMLTSPDNCNPRNDKLYPFLKFGYELINNRCFYYKSLAFKLQQDANIVNTLYPMIIDGTYLNIFPAMVNLGGEEIDSDVIVPGGVTTFTDKDADLRAIQTTSSQGLNAGMQTLQRVDDSLSESSQDPLESGQTSSGTQTAYEISRLEQNAATVLGLFVKMISHYVKSYGQLRLGDILQYLTIIDADRITDNPEGVYKTFLLHDKADNGRVKSRKIVFDANMSDAPMSEDQAMKESYGILSEQGGEDSDTELFKANPELFRNLTYTMTVDADVMNPRSEELERSFSLELYDRAINNPMANQEEVYRLLLSTDPKTKKDPDKYIMEQQVGMADPLAAATLQAQGTTGTQPMPSAGNSPLGAVAGATGQLPQAMGQGGIQQ